MTIDSVTDRDNFVITSRSPDAGSSGLSSGVGAAADVEMRYVEAQAQSGAKSPLLPAAQEDLGVCHDVRCADLFFCKKSSFN